MEKAKDSQKVVGFIRFRPREDPSLLESLPPRDPLTAPATVFETKIALFDNQVHVSRKDEENPDTEKVMAFSYDRVFGPSATQSQIFNEMKVGLVDACLDGFNTSVIAYGQTGSGKSYSIFGPPYPNGYRELGLAPRCIDRLFSLIANEKGEYNIHLSFLEIYLEQLVDLLNPGSDVPLRIRETPSLGVWVEGLSYAVIQSGVEGKHLIELGNDNRQCGSTRTNLFSSRSHALLFVNISKRLTDGSFQQSSIVFTDLAGSEKLQRIGSTEKVLKETKKINHSLLSLSKVVKGVVEGQAHIPFRDSKLTMLLKNSLFDSQSYFLATCSGHPFFVEETIATLKFAQRMSSVKVQPRVNTEMSRAGLSAVCTRLQAEVIKLRLHATTMEDLLRANNIEVPSAPNMSIEQLEHLGGPLDTAQYRLELQQAIFKVSVYRERILELEEYKEQLEDGQRRLRNLLHKARLKYEDEIGGIVVSPHDKRMSSSSTVRSLLGTTEEKLSYELGSQYVQTAIGMVVDHLHIQPTTPPASKRKGRDTVDDINRQLLCAFLNWRPSHKRVATGGAMKARHKQLIEVGPNILSVEDRDDDMETPPSRKPPVYPSGPLDAILAGKSSANEKREVVDVTEFLNNSTTVDPYVSSLVRKNQALIAKNVRLEHEFMAVDDVEIQNVRTVFVPRGIDPLVLHVQQGKKDKESKWNMVLMDRIKEGLCFR